MACKFSCFLNYSQAVKENEVTLFYLDVQDVYTIKYKTNKQRELLLLIKWTISKRVLVTVELCSKSSVKCFSSVGSVIDGKQMFLKLREAYKFQIISDYDILCIITVIPHILPTTARMMEENDFKVDRFVHTDWQTKKTFDQEWNGSQSNFKEDQRRLGFWSFPLKSVPFKDDDILGLPMAKCDRIFGVTECLSTSDVEILPSITSKVVPSEPCENSEAESPRCSVKMINLPPCDRRNVFQALTDEKKVSSSEDANKSFVNEVVCVRNVMQSSYFVKLLNITDSVLQSLKKVTIAIYQRIQMAQWRNTKTQEVQEGMTLSENLNSTEII